MSVGMLVLAAILARCGGAAARAGQKPDPLLRVLGGVLSAGGAWLLAASAGAWSPCWPALALGFIAGVADLLPQRRFIRPFSDGLVVVVAGLLSTPAVPLFALSMSVVLAVGLGLVIDRALKRLAVIWRGVLVGIPVAAVALAVVLKIDDLRTFAGWYGSRTHQVGVTFAQPGERVTLSTGTVAYFARPDVAGPVPGAVLFHGAHRDGARQAAACVFRRALLQAGVAVLSVDHPGFGASPAPSISYPIEEWDPLPAAQAALAALRDRVGQQRIILVGHSLGAIDVFRLLADGADVDGAIVAGTGIGDITPTEDYWYAIFNEPRRLDPWMPRDKWRALNDRYYMPAVFIERILPDRYPMLFVRLGSERLAARPFRTAAWAALPQPKQACTLTYATHNFTAIGEAGLILGETSVTRDLADQVALFVREVHLLPR